jgi:hypothetical protein
MAIRPDFQLGLIEVKVKFRKCHGGLMSHALDNPVEYVYRGREMVIKFEWTRPNDEVPMKAKVIQPSEIHGLGEVVAELSGPWDDYQSVLQDAIAAAECWIDSQFPRSAPNTSAQRARPN